uniref:NADH-ubiquinone oxidoreductase chain 1 n=1 Tax=Clambus sp. CLA01 TaxID=1205546 RepID=A0A0S2MN11_9COLE|nr:NADH deshydrogenase subunit 1 [Clambus sp. CLA01]
MFDLMMILVNGMLMVIMVLVGVAFLTLLERKVLGYIQLRKGPNKVSIMGIAQPFSDAIKLFTKEYVLPMNSNYLMFIFSPVLNLFISLLLWMVVPMSSLLINFNFGVLYFLCLTSVGVYTIMVAGWSSNSNYSLLGGLRAVAQTISYEVSMSLVLMSFLLFLGGFDLLKYSIIQENILISFLFLPYILIWGSIMLAETNRTPFDFAEGESELVSGFNVEYSSGGFALIFLAEYSSIIFMSLLFSMLFLGGKMGSSSFYISVVLISFMFLWVRGTLPRFRYDKLMYLAWKSYLPLSLNMLLFYLGIMMLMYVNLY